MQIHTTQRGRRGDRRCLQRRRQGRGRCQGQRRRARARAAQRRRCQLQCQIFSIVILLATQQARTSTIDDFSGADELRRDDDDVDVVEAAEVSMLDMSLRNSKLAQQTATHTQQAKPALKWLPCFAPLSIDGTQVRSCVGRCVGLCGRPATQSAGDTTAAAAAAVAAALRTVGEPAAAAAAAAAPADGRNLVDTGLTRDAGSSRPAAAATAAATEGVDRVSRPYVSVCLSITKLAPALQASTERPTESAAAATAAATSGEQWQCGQFAAWHCAALAAWELCVDDGFANQWTRNGRVDAFAAARIGSARPAAVRAGNARDAPAAQADRARVRRCVPPDR